MMSDTHTLAQVLRLGYEFDRDDTGSWWYMRGTIRTGPYKSIDDASQDALAEHEINEAYKFWRTQDDQGE